MNAIAVLKELYLQHNREKYPNLPEYARCCKSYSDKNTNGLIHCIVDFLQLQGHKVKRVSTQGRFVDNRVKFEDALGHPRVIGSTKWVNPVKQEHADITAIINNTVLHVKVLPKNDEVQHKGFYDSICRVFLICSSFQGFYDWYMSNFKIGKS